MFIIQLIISSVYFSRSMILRRQSMADVILCPGSYRRVIGFLTTYLQKIVEKNDVRRPERKLQERESVFDVLRKPTPAVRPFYTRILHYFPVCGARCHVVAFVYLVRFLQRQRHAIILDSFNVRRLLLTSLLTATKFELGFGYNNALFVRIGGMVLTDVNDMESAFLDGIDFDRTVTDDDIDKYSVVLYLHGSTTSNLEIDQPIPSALAPSDSEITQSISSPTAPTSSTLVLPCCIYLKDACDCSEEELLE